MFHDNCTARDNDLLSHESLMGMIGFDIACETARSGSRMRSYLVNALRKTIGANVKTRTEVALAA
jgi:hypothetical protein